MNPPRILITGANGQVGFELTRTMQGLGTIVAMDRRSLDLAELDQIRTVVREVRPDLIINAAAYTAVDRAEAEPDLAMRVNGEAPGVLAEEAARLHAPLIHYSTDYVFNGTKDGLYTEEDATDPQNVYGVSKLAGERAIAAVGGPHLIFRTSWVYGARGRNFMLTILRLASEHKKLRIVGDQVGAPTWSMTIATMTAHIVAQGRAATDLSSWYEERSGIYHLTASGATSWFGFASAIFELARPDVMPTLESITTAEYPTPAVRQANSRLSNEKLATVFGLRAPDWRDALRWCIEAV